MDSNARPALDVPDESIAEFVLAHGSRDPQKTAIVDGVTGEAITYRELRDGARRLAAGLALAGLGKGDVIAICSPNRPEYAIAWYGAALAGVAVMPVLPSDSESHLLRLSRARLLIADPRLIASAAPAAAQAGIDRIYAFGDSAHAQPFTKLLGPPDDPPSVDIDARNDVALISCFPGVTGVQELSWPIEYTHHGLIASILQASAVNQMTSSEVVVAIAPFHRPIGLSCVMNTTLHAGATLVTVPTWDLHQFLTALEHYGVTTAHVMSPMVRMLTYHPAVAEHDLSRLRRVISPGAFPERLTEACAARLGCMVQPSAGLPQTCGFTHMTRRGATKPGSVGVPVAGCEARIVDVTGSRELSAGDIGQMWVRGPQVMKGYLHNPELTRRVIDRDGWLHSGLIAYTDREGDLFPMDRALDQTAVMFGMSYRDEELLPAMVQELAERRRIAERLQFQAVLLDSVRESVIGIDCDRRVTFWNKGAEELFGYTAEEAVGAPFESLAIPRDPELRALFDREMRQVAVDGHWHGEVQRRRKDGTLFWSDTAISVVKSPEGTISGFLGLSRNVTELRRSQQMLRDSHERLQNLAERTMNIREDERAAIARELHDEFGQALTWLKMDLSWFTERLPKRLQTNRARFMVQVIDGLIKDVQHLSSRLRPAILDDLGLESAIAWHAREFERLNRCRCVLDLQMGSVRPDAARSTAIFRVLQEALTNVTRHAHATLVSISCRAESTRLVLEVIDNGVGIGQDHMASARSLGLLGMRERARAVGGTIDIARHQGGGTRISLTVPLQGRSESVP